MRITPRTRGVLGLAAAAGLLIVGGVAPATASPVDAGTTPAEERENLPGVPEPGAPAAEWEAWSAADREELIAYDWAAEVAARGCELLDVKFVDEVAVELNLAMGAPADLVTTRVDTAEDCEGDIAAALGSSAGSDALSTQGDVGVLSVPPGNQCNSQTQGPGTICIKKANGKITVSWNYRGTTPPIYGYMRIYQIHTNVTGCPTGTTWHTSDVFTWYTNSTISSSRTQTQNGAYSAHIWRDYGPGYTSWGRTCGIL